MPRENLTFGDAVNRANELVKFYSTEKTRLEDNLTKVLLPAGLTFTATMLQDVIDSKYLGAAIFLIFFFGAYAVLIYYDLHVAEAAWAKAFELQSKLYAHEKHADRSALLSEIVLPDVLHLYDSVDKGVGKRWSIPPTAKPLIALAAGLIALGVCRNL